MMGHRSVCCWCTVRQSAVVDRRRRPGSISMPYQTSFRNSRFPHPFIEFKPSRRAVDDSVGSSDKPTTSRVITPRCYRRVGSKSLLWRSRWRDVGWRRVGLSRMSHAAWPIVRRTSSVLISVLCCCRTDRSQNTSGTEICPNVSSGS